MKPPDKPPVNLNIRISAPLLARIDAYRAILRQGSPAWQTITRTDAVRALILEGLKRAKVE